MSAPSFQFLGQLFVLSQTVRGVLQWGTETAAVTATVRKWDLPTVGGMFQHQLSRVKICMGRAGTFREGLGFVWKWKGIRDANIVMKVISFLPCKMINNSKSKWRFIHYIRLYPRLSSKHFTCTTGTPVQINTRSTPQLKDTCWVINVQ